MIMEISSGSVKPDTFQKVFNEYLIYQQYFSSKLNSCLLFVSIPIR